MKRSRKLSSLRSLVGLAAAAGVIAPVANAQLEEAGPLGFYTNVNSGGAEPVATVVAGTTTYEFVQSEEVRALLTVDNALDEYPFNSTVNITSEGQNGWAVRAYQIRSHLSDGSRTSRITQAGDSIAVQTNGSTRVRAITGKIYEYAAFNVTDVIAPDNDVDFQANNLGAPGSIPLEVMQAAITKKAPKNQAGVVNFDDPMAGPNFFTGEMEDIPEDTNFAFREIRAILPNDREVVIGINKDLTYNEAGGDNLATVDGPGPTKDLAGSWIIDGEPEFPPAINFNPSGRVPTSGNAGLGSVTTYAFDFDPMDEVVMAGLVYCSRQNFQHGNPDNIDKVWAKATYSDGSTSETLASNNLQDVPGAFDNFFGFESPQGLYITQIQVWCRGQNSRAFTIVDDLSFVLEGGILDTHIITATSSNEARGTVTGGAQRADGAAATLMAEAAEGFSFLGWTYVDGPVNTIFSTEPTVDVIAHGPKNVQGIFVEAGIGEITNSTGRNPSLRIPLEDGVDTYEYIIDDVVQAIVTVEGAASSYPNGGIVRVSAEGKNGYGVRLLQTRKYYADGGRSGNRTIPSTTADILIDGETRIRIITGKLYEFASFPVTDVIAPDNAIDFEAGNLGAPGSLPLSALRKAVAAKTPVNLGGVINFEESFVGPNTFSGVEEVIEPGTGFAFREIRAELLDFSEITIGLNMDTTYVEAGGDNLATVDGPGPNRDLNQGWTFNGQNEVPLGLAYNPSGRVPSSGIAGAGSVTAYGFDFSADDKVVMAGLAYMSRRNFQHGNPDNIDKLWSKAIFSDGSTSETLASSNLQDVAGAFDNFFAFEAPDGLYITQLQVWCRGQNSRAFTIIDDLTFVLEGDEATLYEVTGVSNNEERGTVTGGGSFGDGTVATLTAAPVDGFVFAGWVYADDPNMAIIGSDLTLDVVANGPKDIKALFVEPGVGNITNSTGRNPSVSIPLEDGVDTYEYTIDGVVQAIVTVDGAAGAFPNGGIVNVSAVGQNGYGVRLLQARSYYADGSRSGNTTLPGNSAKFLIDGETRIRIITGKLYEYAIYPVVDVIAPDNAIDFEADNLGAAGSIPLSAFNEVLAVKTPLSLGGVINFEDPIIGPNTFSGVEEIIEPGTGVGVRQLRAELADFSEIQINLNKDKHYVEAGGDNLATVDGPGPNRDLNQGWTFNGQNEVPLGIAYNPGGRVPSSGIGAAGSTTSWAFDFSADDRVVMAGMAYMSRQNFQHGNPDNIDKLWANATFSDGSTSETLSSMNLQDVAGEYDNFFGFEAPAGLYITQIHVWCRGQNSRAFTVIDDLAFILEGAETDSYDVSVAYDDTLGTVTGEATVIDGTNASLEAAANAGSSFFGWYYDGAPYAPFSTAAIFETPVFGPKSLVAVFDEGSYGANPDMIDIMGGAQDADVWVYALPEDEWTATANGDWIVLPDTPAMGSGWLALSIAPNLGTENRVGTVSIGDEAILTVTQLPLANDLFPGAVYLGGSEYEGSWLDTTFALYGVGNEVFVGTVEHGWWQVVAADGYVWGYDYNLALWLAIVPETYPWLYSPDLDGYLYYLKGSTTPNRWFYDVTTESWVNESAL